MHTPTGPRPPEAADVPRRRRVCRDLLASGALAYLSTRERSDVPASGQTNREISPYSADQAAMFARGEMTTVADTRADGERAVGGHRNLHILVGGGGRAFPDVRAPGHARQKPPTCRDVAACGEISSPVAWPTRPHAGDRTSHKRRMVAPCRPRAPGPLGAEEGRKVPRSDQSRSNSIV